MLVLIAITLSLLVIAAGLFLLLKSRKEEMGRLFSFASYAILTLGILSFGGAFIGGIMHACCSNGGGPYGKTCQYRTCGKATPHCKSMRSCGPKACGNMMHSKGHHGHGKKGCGSKASFHHGMKKDHKGWKYHEKMKERHGKAEEKAGSDMKEASGDDKQ